MVKGRPVPFPVTTPAIGVVAGPRMFHMADWVNGGKTCQEQHAEIDAKFECVWDREAEKKKLETKVCLHYNINYVSLFAARTFFHNVFTK